MHRPALDPVALVQNGWTRNGPGRTENIGSSLSLVPVPDTVCFRQALWAAPITDPWFRDPVLDKELSRGSIVCVCRLLW